jgi:hypothetical protein
MTTNSPAQPYLKPQPAAQRVQIHPLVIGKSTTTANSATVLEFTLADPGGGRTGEDEMSWYARELGQVESLAVPDALFLKFH